MLTPVTPEEAVGDDLVAELVKATLTKKQSEEGVIDMEERRQDMNNILSGRLQRELPIPPRSASAGKQQEAGVSLCR